MTLPDAGPRCSVCGYPLVRGTGKCELRCHERPADCNVCHRRLSNELRMNGITTCIECLELGRQPHQNQAKAQ